MKIKDIFRKNFYRQQFFLLSRKKPFDYIFFDWSVFLVLLLIFCVGYIFLFPYSYGINMPAMETQAALLESILRTIGVLFGITFSLIVLSFNIFYRYFGRYAFLDFFKNRSAKICITLLFAAVVLLSYSVYFIKEAPVSSSFSNFIFFFSIMLSIVSFFSIFPCFIFLLRNSQNRKNIINLFNKLNEDVAVARFIAKMEGDMHTFHQKDPINIINEIGLMSVKESDFYNIELITDTMVDFFRTNVTNKEEEKYYVDFKDLYYKFFDSLENFYFLALKEKNEYIAILVMRTIFRIERLVFENIEKEGFEEFLGHGEKYRYLNLNFTTEKFFKKALQYGEDDICQEIIEEYRSFSKAVFVKLFPPEVNYIGSNRFDTAQKCEVVFEPLAKFLAFAEILAPAKKHTLFKEIFNSFYVYEVQVLDLETTDSTKCFILNVIHNYKKECFQKYIDLNDVQQISYLNFPFKEGANVYEKIKCKIPHLGLLEMIDMLFAKGKLNNVVINQAKAQMLHMIRIDDEVLIKDLVQKFVDISHRIDVSASLDRKDLYIKLHENLRIVQRDAIAKPATEAVREMIQLAIASFDKLEAYKQELKKVGYVSDARII